MSNLTSESCLYYHQGIVLTFVPRDMISVILAVSIWERTSQMFILQNNLLNGKHINV